MRDGAAEDETAASISALLPIFVPAEGCTSSSMARRKVRIAEQHGYVAKPNARLSGDPKRMAPDADYSCSEDQGKFTYRPRVS